MDDLALNRIPTRMALISALHSCPALAVSADRTGREGSESVDRHEAHSLRRLHPEEVGPARLRSRQQEAAPVHDCARWCWRVRACVREGQQSWHTQSTFALARGRA